MTDTQAQALQLKYDKLNQIAAAIQDEFLFSKANDVFLDKNVGTRLYAWHEIMIDESLYLVDEKFQTSPKTFVPKSKKSEADFNNDMGALVLACVWGRAKFPFTVDLPRDLYKVYSDEVKYREEKVKSFSDESKFQTGVVKPHAIEKAMLNLAQQIRIDQTNMEDSLRSNENDWAYILLTLAKHHILFETIHPFSDCNGRIGRYLISYETNYLGIPEFPLLREQKEEYYASFLPYQNSTCDPDLIHDLCLDMALLFGRNLLSTYVTFNRKFGDESQDIAVDIKTDPAYVSAQILSSRLDRHQEPSRYGNSKMPDGFLHEDLEYLGDLRLDIEKK